jgi:L-asparagine transporter-like permease
MATFEWKGTHEGQLRRALRVRHLVMLAVGGTIASGFLLFAGSAIGIAGPAVIISYVIAGIITVAVMACLAELAVQKPVSASFATYARDTMGPLSGHTAQADRVLRRDLLERHGDHAAADHDGG